MSDDLLQQAVALPDHQAIQPLLAAWRTTHASAIADLLDLLNDRLTTAQPAIPPSAWIAICAQNNPSQLGALMASFPPKKLHSAQRFLVLLGQREPDPRLANALLNCLESPPFRSKNSFVFWSLLVRTVLSIKDPRSTARLAQHDQIIDRFEPNARPLIQKILRVIPQSTPHKMSHSPTDHLIMRLRKRWQPDQAIEQHLDAVFDHSDDLSQRVVLADLYASVGDPRGEFILLQLADAEGRLSSNGRRRMNTLQKAHWRQWAAPLEPLFKHPYFVEGFFAGGTLNSQSAEMVQETVGHRNWRMVRRVEISSKIPTFVEPAVTTALLDPIADGIEQLSGRISRPFFHRLATGVPRPALHTLGPLYLPQRDRLTDELQAVFANAPALVGLHTLKVIAWRGDAHANAWFLDGDLVARITTLTLHIERLNTLLSWLDAMPPSVQQLTLTNALETKAEITCQRHEGQFRTLTLLASSQSQLRRLLIGLHVLPVDLVHTLKIRWTHPQPPGAELQTLLDQFIARCTALKQLKLPDWHR